MRLHTSLGAAQLVSVTLSLPALPPRPQTTQADRPQIGSLLGFASLVPARGLSGYGIRSEQGSGLLLCIFALKSCHNDPRNGWTEVSPTWQRSTLRLERSDAFPMSH